MIFSIMCSGILYASVCSFESHVAWQFLCVILKNYDMVPFVYKNVVSQEIDQNDPLTVKWRYICSAAMGIAIIPLVYQRTLGSLRYFSMYTFLAMCSTIVVD